MGKEERDALTEAVRGAERREAPSSIVKNGGSECCVQRGWERGVCYGALRAQRAERVVCCEIREQDSEMSLGTTIGIRAKFKSPESHRSDFGGERKPISNSDQIRSTQKWRLSIPPDSSRRDEAPAPNRVKIGRRTSPHAPPEVRRVRSTHHTRARGRRQVPSTRPTRARALAREVSDFDGKALSEFSRRSGFIREHDETSAHGLWTKLEEMYREKTSQNKVLLRRLVLKLQRGTTVAEQTIEFQSATGRGQKKRSQEGGHRGQEKRSRKRYRQMMAEGRIQRSSGISKMDGRGAATVAQRHAKQAQEYLMDVLEGSTVEQERKEMLWDTCGSLARHEKVQPLQDVHEEAQRRETESMHNDRRDVAETSLFRSRSVAVISPVVHTREERWSHDDLQSDVLCRAPRCAMSETKSLIAAQRRWERKRERCSDRSCQRRRKKRSSLLHCQEWGLYELSHELICSSLWPINSEDKQRREEAGVEKCKGLGALIGAHSRMLCAEGLGERGLLWCFESTESREGCVLTPEKEKGAKRNTEGCWVCTCARMKSSALGQWICWKRPSVVVVIPRSPRQPKGLLLSSIRNLNPVVFLESKWLYRLVVEEVPEHYYMLPLSEAELSIMKEACVEAEKVNDAQYVSD
ncbi:transketolase family protein [Actinidia rufa]|uniref:Transketolase family protein n=1 Tax=Actinidia rufa TaxID=165716 RepID=A0A7J0H505_9ERIC|nr:transketolase family protein [Actinidia rufa]